MKILLILPAYNEEQGLQEVLSSFHEILISMGCGGCAVIVDDGSRDGTASVARQWGTFLPVELLQHSENMGLGATIRDGLRRAVSLAQPGDIIVTMDADNTHPPALIPQMVSRIVSGCDIVIASRFQPGSLVTGLSLSRSILSSGARLIFGLLLPVEGVKDYTCGYRAFRAEVLANAFQEYGQHLVTERGFTSTVEILVKVARIRPKICEVPLVLRYGQKQGQSKMRVASTIHRTLIFLVRSRTKRHGGPFSG